MKLIALSLMTLTTAIALVGCAHRIQLKVVDAETHEALGNVSVQWLQVRHQMLETLKQEGPTNLPPTGPDGMICVSGLHRWWTSEFIFVCPGYSNIYGLYGSGRLSLAEMKSPFPPGPLQDQFILEGNLKSAQKSNGCFLVEMRK
jgi:hypothetical protein